MTQDTTQDRPMLSHSAPAGRIAVAHFVLFWEKFWPALLPGLLPIALFLIVSLFDGWKLLSPGLHWCAIITTILCAAGLWYRSFRAIAWPSRREALARVEHDSAFAHAPLQAASDAPFVGDEDSPAYTLWQRHQHEMARQAGKARVKGAYATAEHVDPFALRFALAGLIILGIFAAGPMLPFRILSAIEPGTARQSVASRADMWIDPPAYTGLAPVYLVRGGEPLPELSDQINIPTGSIVTALINGERGADVSFTTADGNSEYAKPPSTDAPVDGKAGQQNQQKAPSTNAHRVSLPLTDSGILQLRLAGQRGLWPINVQADKPPIILFVTPPAANDKRQLKLHYTFTDDYGAAQTRLVFRLDPDQQRPLDAPPFDRAAMEQARSIAIEGAEGPSGERQHVVNLDEDPWAGLSVLAKLVVIDGAGQSGETEEVSVELPTRPFFNPLAKAVIEQRQNLSVAGAAIQNVRDALAGLTLVPEEFYEDTGEYLLLRTAFWKVQTDKDGQYEEIVDHFWPLALELEDQALELARRRLDAAIEALRQALEQGASDSVINQRREDVEKAIENYIQALAQSGIPEGESGQGSNQLGANQLQEMLDAIGDLSQSGANNAARQLLSDLENILDNLQLQKGGIGQGGIPNPNANSQGEGEGESDGQSEGLGEQAGELIGRQRELSDETFERRQNEGGDSGDLANQQGQLGAALQELLDNLQEGGQGTTDNPSGSTGGGNDPDPNGTGERALKDALRAMQQSQEALNEDNLDSAGSAMDRAIAKLREGAQALAEAQAGQTGEGQGEGSDGQEGDGLDPLGRSTNGRNGGNGSVPDTSDPARTREVIDELRRRLGEQGRSQEEIEYLERLLDAF